MLETILAPLTSFVLAVISSWGYAGIVFCMAIESACIPLPSEIIMPFSDTWSRRGDSRCGASCSRARSGT